MNSINSIINEIQSFSENLSPSIWSELLTIMLYILRENWFREEKNKAEELIQAMQNGNKEKATEIIESHKESEEIKETIGSICEEISEDDKVDHKKIESLKRWAK